MSRLLYWPALAVLCLIVAITLPPSLSRIGQTFPGFLVTSDARLSYVVAPHWHGAKEPLPWLRPVVAVDGRPMSSGRELTAHIAALPPGVPVTYTVQGNTGRQRFTITTQRFGAKDWLATWGIAWILGIGTALCGAVVSWLKPTHPVAGIHFAACMLLAVYYLGLPDATSDYALMPAPFHFFVHVLGLGAWGLLATVFPRPVPYARTLQVAWWCGALGMIVWSCADLLNGTSAGLTTMRLVWGTVNALALPIGAAWTAWRSDSTPHDQAVGKVILLGFGVPVLIPTVTGWAQNQLGEASFLLTAGYLALLAYPVAIAYAIVRHRLFGIDLVIRRTLTYTLAGGGMMALYAGVVALARLAIGQRSTLEGVIAAMVIAVAFGPWRDRVKRWLDRRFFRTPYDPGEVVAAFDHRAGDAAEPDHLMATFADCLDGALGLRGVEVTLVEGAAFRRGDGAGGVEVPVSLPLAFDQRLLGEIRIGSKRSDLPFTQADHRLIGDLSRRLALWLHLVERVAAERQNRDLIAMLQRSDEMRGAFLNLVSHELRRPLSEILATVQLLTRPERQESASASQGRHLQRLHLSAALLAGLVNDLLDAGQLQSGHFRLRPGPLDIAQVVDDALNAVRPAADEKELRLAASVPPCPAAWGDHLRLVQVLTNLLANAIRHTAAGGSVTVHVGVTEAAWSCEVTDTGEGIPAEQLPDLFERFGGLEAGAHHPDGGLGLGLFICRSIVTAHGGTIAVHSQRGFGSTFTLTLPLQLPVPSAQAVG